MVEMVDFVDIGNDMEGISKDNSKATVAETQVPFLALRKRVKEVANTEIAMKTQAAEITQELKKLAPTLSKFGLKMVINGREVVVNDFSYRKRLAAQATKRPGSKTNAEGKLHALQQQGLRLLEEMKQAHGGALTGSEVMEEFQLSPATLHRRRKEHRVMFWRDAKHAFHYPRWQFTGTGALLKGIQEVLQIFKSDDEWRVMRYFLAPRQQLEGKTPLECLREGKSAKVIEHAKLHEAENSW